jgi:hypothetical protein
MQGISASLQNAIDQIDRAQGNVPGLAGRVTVLCKDGIITR